MALLLVALIRWESTLSFLGRYLIDSQPPQSADLILVLAGNFYGPRVLKGAELVTAGYAPLTLISGTPYQGRPEDEVKPEGELAITFPAASKATPRVYLRGPRTPVPPSRKRLPFAASLPGVM